VGVDGLVVSAALGIGLGIVFLDGAWFVGWFVFFEVSLGER